MNKNSFFFLSMLLGITLLATSCQKGKDLVDPPTQTELLIDGAWILTAQDIEPPLPLTSNVSDEYAQLDDCEKDDNLNFTETNTFTLDEGATKCSELDPQVWSGTWGIINEGAVLSLDYTLSPTEERNIITLERDEMVLTETFTLLGVNYTRTFKYTH